MSTIQNVIVVEWLATILGAVLFLAAYGLPWRYKDRTMAWHLASVTAVAGLEALGLLLISTVGMLPLAIVYGAAAGIVYWRLWLLLRTRRR